MRQLRLNSYPLLWQLTSSFSRWPRMTHTYLDLEAFHQWFRSWYYEAGGLHLSENSRARYGEVQELMATHLGAPEGQPMPAQPGGPIPDSVYSGLLEACSALRTALTEDLESRRQRSVLHSIGLAARHRKQKTKAAARLAKARRDRSQRDDATPFDGVVTRWQVQGAGGPIRLIVARGEVRPGGRSSLERVQGSAEQLVQNARRQTFRTRLMIRKGDVVGLQFSVGAYGNAPYSEGTWLELWIPPLGLERRRAEDSGSRDYELLYNAFIERDADRDGFGDATQDKCPKDPGKQEGC